MFTDFRGIHVVAFRLRGLNNNEIKKSGDALETTMVVGWKALQEKKTVIELSNRGEPLPTRKGKTSFSFNKAFDIQSSNTDVYSACVKTVESFIHGINGSIIIYGQSGSGKTFTAFGNNTQNGITHFVGMDILNHMRRNPQLQFNLKMSAFEVYNTEVRDLRTQSAVHMRQDPKTLLLMEISEINVTDLKSFYDFVDVCRNSKVRKSEMNQNSSRSHVFFRLTLTGVIPETSETEIRQFESTLHIVDLAGSDNSLRNVRKVDGNLQKEANHINKRLVYNLFYLQHFYSISIFHTAQLISFSLFDINGSVYLHCQML